MSGAWNLRGDVRHQDMPYVHARRFGAALDGVTDDTTALQNAAASGERITLGGRTAKVTETIQVIKSLANGVLEVPDGALDEEPVIHFLAAAGESNIDEEHFHGLRVNGNGDCDAFKLSAHGTAGVDARVISACVFERLYARNVRDFINADAGAHSQVYRNTFRDLRAVGIGRHGVKTVGLAYTAWLGVECTDVDAGYAFDMAEAASHCAKFSCDGPVSLNLSLGSIVDGLAVEGIISDTPVSAIAVALNGTGLIARAIRLIDLPSAKAEAGLQIFSSRANITGVYFEGTEGPAYSIYLAAGSSGTLVTARKAPAIASMQLIETGSGAGPMAGWNIGDCDLSNKNTIGVKVVSALPTAAEALRGSLLTVNGGAGVADVTSICRKNSGDTYEWAAVA